MPLGSLSSLLWWGMAGLALIFTVGMLVGLLTADRPSPAVNDAAPCASAVPPGSEGVEPLLGEMGDFAPTYDLRDLTCLTLPEAHASHRLTDERGRGATAGRSAMYSSVEDGTSFTVRIMGNRLAYVTSVADLAEPKKVGKAVCGSRNAGEREPSYCLMAGALGAIMVESPDGNLSVEDLSLIVQDFYDLA